jgi:hypothetical protein
MRLTYDINSRSPTQPNLYCNAAKAAFYLFQIKFFAIDTLRRGAFLAALEVTGKSIDRARVICLAPRQVRATSGDRLSLEPATTSGQLSNTIAFGPAR